MASSSRSRSRSNKRSPGRGEPSKETEEKPDPGTVLPKGEEGANEADVSAEPRKARTTGAVQNRRKKGEPGTWTCDHCQRTISDNPCSKKQHLDSLYCRACRLYNDGYGGGDWEACKKKAERILWGEPEPKGPDLRLRGLEPPPEPKLPPRHERSKQSLRSRSTDRRDRARSSGRRSYVEHRRNRSRSRDRRRQSRKDSGNVTEQPEYVKVVVEKYEPRFNSKRPEGMPKPPEKAPPSRPVVQQELAVGKEKEGKQQQQRGKTTSAAEDGHESSSDYTYEYESSTPEGGDAQGKAAAAPEGKGSAGDKAASSGAGQKAVPPQKAEGKDRAAGKATAAAADAAGQHKDLMVALLKTAMETVGKSFQ